MDLLHTILTYFAILLFISVGLSSISAKWDYRVKITWLYVIYFLSGLVVIPYGLIVQDFMKTSLFWAKILTPVSTLVNLKWEIIGQENIDRKKPYVVVCNHQSSIDVLAVQEMWSLFDKIVIVGKKALKYAGPFGLAMTLGGAIFVDRAKSEKGRKAVNEAGQKAKESGCSLFVFPEGTRNSGGGLLPFKKGAFHVALDVQMPILPIVVSEYKFLGPSRHDQFPGGKVVIQILPAIETDHHSKDTIDDLIKETRDVMMNTLMNLE